MIPRALLPSLVGVPLALLGLLGGSRAAADLAEVRARGVLKVLAAADEDPEWFSVTGRPTPGFEREVLEGFARLHRLRFEVVEIVRWEDAIPMLVQGKGDVLAGVNDTPERRKLVHFTAELLPARNVVVTRRPGARVASEAELRSARVAVVPETTWAEAVSRAGVPANHIERVDDVSAALAALKSGRATATVMDIIDYLQQRRRDPQLELGPTLGSALSSAWAVRKSDPELGGALDAFLVGFARARPGAACSCATGDDAPAVLGR
jgi:ABC-type amino acid transport substrate-binding protein